MDSVLLLGEAEGYIQSLEKMALRDMGSPRWFRQHEYIEKLNMQAILNASANQEEFIKDLFVSLGKIPTLVHAMILTEVWKHKVFPIICKLQDFKPKSTFLLYMVIHHEATIINLLETIMYHKESSEAAGDSVLDLLDYCHRKLTLLAGRSVSGQIPTEDRITHAQLSDTASVQDLQRQSDMLEFEISVKALSVLCYVTDHIESLSLSVLSRMLCTHNMPCVLVQLVENCPWNRGTLEKYTEGKWRTVRLEDQLKLSKHDGQVWMALLNLLLKPDCQRKYDFNSFNKTQLLKLRGFLTDVVIDQLPNLLDLRHFLSQLTVTDPAAPKKDLILEQVPEIWNNIVTENSSKWKAIAKYQVTHVFNPSESELREQASRLAQTYNLDVMENLIPDKPKCGACGRVGAKRCSRCQGEWYCNRECQVKHWPKHKPACKLMAEAIEKLQEELNISS
ncbi:zinc finger MYND domain-containing protein 10 [Sinocyclocheilus anshuiensis]|uniref:Zinc finger MYND domain-containing protein 10 n=1 Tax=Sinocyclocheilus anshuiensis TaxID=1608454 RepID=A0A671KAW2_9TELE|nr:PREDICTED: zinc finger MYND domain-containing protein 10 [Sinocyclocheilus anshuiensis]